MAKPGAARETFRSSVFTVHPQQGGAAAYGPVAQLIQHGGHGFGQTLFFLWGFTLVDNIDHVRVASARFLSLEITAIFRSCIIGVKVHLFYSPALFFITRHPVPLF